MLVVVADDVDDVAVAELVSDWLHLAVDARAGDAIAELRVDPVREVDRRRATGKDAHVALGREDVDLVLEEIDFDAFEKFGRVLEILLPLHQLTEPSEFLLVRFAD